MFLMDKHYDPVLHCDEGGEATKCLACCGYWDKEKRKLIHQDHCPKIRARRWLEESGDTRLTNP